MTSAKMQVHIPITYNNRITSNQYMYYVHHSSFIRLTLTSNCQMEYQQREQHRAVSKHNPTPGS